ncbi:hypothetical protein JB92DRAFT_2900918 [Gautieria morchelliformis]|nr:hypothetical protein JB92DRAFT_2900918 [Gautieria morchelliformis]
MTPRHLLFTGSFLSMSMGPASHPSTPLSMTTHRLHTDSRPPYTASPHTVSFTPTYAPITSSSHLPGPFSPISDTPSSVKLTWTTRYGRSEWGMKKKSRYVAEYCTGPTPHAVCPRPRTLWRFQL